MEEIASKVSSNKSNVSRWERGINVPNQITLKKIADLGDMTVDQLLYGDITKELTQIENFIKYSESLDLIVEFNAVPLSSYREDVFDDDGIKIGETEIIDNETFEVTIIENGKEVIYSEDEFEELQDNIKKLLLDELE